MASTEFLDEFRVQFSVAYSSSQNPHDHSIEAELLAPSLVATSKLLKEMNYEANKKSTECNLRIISEFERKCFNINFELITSIIDAAMPLIESERAKTAKDILEWAGLLGGYVGLSGFSLIKFLKWKRGRKVTSANKKNIEGSDAVVVTIEGEKNSVVVNKNIYNISEKPIAMKYMRDIFSPIGINSIDSIEFRKEGEISEKLDEVDVRDIISSCNQTIASNDNNLIESEQTTAWLSVYSPVYDEKADKWRFKYGNEHIYADISETNISKDALARGGALAEDAYQVILEIQFSSKKSKQPKPTYKVVKVLKFIPGSPIIQGSLI